MADDKKKEGKVKKLTALKRDQQAIARNLRNRAFKSQVTSAIRTFEGNLSKNDIESTKTSLKSVYSLMDKGVKKGIYKLNKASRVKSRLDAKVKRTANA